MGAVSVGSIVKCRGREWVVLPSDDEELYLLRPLAGTEQEVIGIGSAWLRWTWIDHGP